MNSRVCVDGIWSPLDCHCFPDLSSLPVLLIFCIIVSYIHVCHMHSFIVINCRVFVSFFIQLMKTFGSKRLVLSNLYRVHKAQIKKLLLFLLYLRLFGLFPLYMLQLPLNYNTNLMCIRLK